MKERPWKPEIHHHHEFQKSMISWRPWGCSIFAPSQRIDLKFSMRLENINNSWGLKTHCDWIYRSGAMIEKPSENYILLGADGAARLPAATNRVTLREDRWTDMHLYEPFAEWNCATAQQNHKILMKSRKQRPWKHEIPWNLKFQKSTYFYLISLNRWLRRTL